MFAFGPGVDAKSENPFLPVDPEIAAEKGVQVPLLIGSNSREGIFLMESKLMLFWYFFNN